MYLSKNDKVVYNDSTGALVYGVLFSLHWPSCEKSTPYRLVWAPDPAVWHLSFFCVEFWPLQYIFYRGTENKIDTLQTTCLLKHISKNKKCECQYDIITSIQTNMERKIIIFNRIKIVILNFLSYVCFANNKWNLGFLLFFTYLL